jgi:DNA-binding MarR family transcriptional regulator
LLTPQTVSVIIANLERAGSIQRRPHQVHGRILRVELSDSGLVLLEQCRLRVHSVENELTEGLSETDEARSGDGWSGWPSTDNDDSHGATRYG